MGRRHILKDFLERGIDPKKAHSQLDSKGRLKSTIKKVAKPVEAPAVVAEPVLVAEPIVEAEEVELVRAREEDGQYLGDDPATPSVDEAWVEVPEVPEVPDPVAIESKPEPVVAVPEKPKRTPRKKPVAKTTRAKRAAPRKAAAKKQASED